MPSSIITHVDVLYAVFIGALGVICFLTVRTLKQVDENLKALWAAHDKHKEDLAEVTRDLASLRATHDALMFSHSLHKKKGLEE